MSKDEQEPVEEATDGRKARGDRTRASILESAVRIASIGGLEGLTIGRVASAARVSKASVQALFGSREALQIKTLDLAASLIGSAILRRVPAGASGIAKLRALCDGWFAVVADGLLPGGCLMTSATSEYRARPGSVKDAVAAHRLRWKSLLLDAARAAQADSSLDPDANIERLVYVLLALEGAANGPALDASEFTLARETTRDLLTKRQTLASLGALRSEKEV